MFSLIINCKWLVGILEESSKGSLGCMWLILWTGSSFNPFLMPCSFSLMISLISSLFLTPPPIKTVPRPETAPSSLTPSLLTSGHPHSCSLGPSHSLLNSSRLLVCFLLLFLPSEVILPNPSHVLLLLSLAQMGSVSLRQNDAKSRGLASGWLSDIICCLPASHSRHIGLHSLLRSLFLPQGHRLECACPAVVHSFLASFPKPPFYTEDFPVHRIPSSLHGGTYPAFPFTPQCSSLSRLVHLFCSLFSATEKRKSSPETKTVPFVSIALSQISSMVPGPKETLNKYLLWTGSVGSMSKDTLRCYSGRLDDRESSEPLGHFEVLREWIVAVRWFRAGK